jgi:hypothetical protein
MKPTEQQKALNRARKEFGGTSFTEDHINYKRIGYKVNGRFVSQIGDTWDEVFAKISKVKGKEEPHGTIKE